ncbi:MerR family transcriptional regulator [Desulfallas sp. Bu1-1]|uniref:MerR family transcriptional regulator n=1 Tax=Desulfallas sp. Bu1-1 TaxID=2787620 RepID=UPI0018A03FC5|nr:MerR family transcriptional regulator [Desulfallas sp. Bu1-1]MBF7083821.1 MerR family transcriptional regulator [Desulfallas sp. Bu1-1]
MGEIAELAGVSRRTIDYYTNLGLLKPIRSESNYRYYTEDSLVRLKIIESLKAGRFTLEEIREHLSILDDGTAPELNRTVKKDGSVNIDLLRKQIKQLENHLVQLEPRVGGLEAGQAVLLRKKIMMQSIALIQSLMMYINEITSYL